MATLAFCEKADTDTDIPIAHAVPVPTLPAALRAWVTSLRLRDLDALAQAFDGLGVGDVEDLSELDAEQIRINTKIAEEVRIKLPRNCRRNSRKL